MNFNGKINERSFVEPTVTKLIQENFDSQLKLHDSLSKVFPGTSWRKGSDNCNKIMDDFLKPYKIKQYILPLKPYFYDSNLYLFPANL